MRSKVLQLGRFPPGQLHYRVRKLRKLGNVDTKALIADTVSDLVQQRQLAVAHVSRDVKVANGRNLVREHSKLMKVRCKQAERTDLRCDMLGDSVSEAKPIVGRGSATELVNDDERVFGGG